MAVSTNDITVPNWGISLTDAINLLFNNDNKLKQNPVEMYFITYANTTSSDFTTQDEFVSPTISTFHIVNVSNPIACSQVANNNKVLFFDHQYYYIAINTLEVRNLNGAITNPADEQIAITLARRYAETPNEVEESTDHAMATVIEQFWVPNDIISNTTASARIINLFNPNDNYPYNQFSYRIQRKTNKRPYIYNNSMIILAFNRNSR